jgi:hypothetical protein
MPLLRLQVLTARRWGKLGGTERNTDATRFAVVYVCSLWITLKLFLPINLMTRLDPT